MEDSLKPKVKVWKLVLLSGIIFATNLGYGIESAYAIPLVVAAGLDIAYASLLLTVSPFIGIIVHAYLGSVSDRCKCRWGRRRPFILLLAITMIIGCLISPFSPLLNTSNFPHAAVLGIGLTGLGVMIFDLSLGQIQLPSRAYLLDVIPVSQVQRGNFVMTLMAGIGGFFGYVLGGIDWASLVNVEANIVSEAQIFFMLGIVLIVISLLCTLFSVKETPVTVPPVSEGTSPVSPSTGSTSCCFCTSATNLFCDFFSTIVESVKFVFYLSKEMWILWLSVFFGFVSNFTVSLFFTTFVGEVVYGGDSSAAEDSKLYHSYVQGVQMGSLGLAISLAFMTISMIASDWLTKYVSLKAVYLSIQYSNVIALFAMNILTSVPAVMVLVSFTGPYLGTLLTYPYILIGVYKDKSLMFRKPWPSATDSVEGRACFVINSAMFMGQCVAVLITGPIIRLVGTATVSLTISCIASVIGLLFGSFCKVPDPVETPTIKE